MSAVKILSTDVIRYKDEYLKFEVNSIVDLKDEKLVDLLVQFGVAEKVLIENKKESEDIIEIELEQELPFVKAKSVVEEFKEVKKEKPVKKEGKKSIFFEVN